MPLPPVWISADAQALQLPLTNQSYRDMVNATTRSLAAAAATVDANAAKSLDVSNRMKAWYAELYADKADPIKDMTDAVVNYVGDTLSSGVYMYLPVPDYGGFPAILDSLTRSLVIAGDANRPKFTDDEHVAGVVLLAAGGKLQVMIALAAVVTLMGGDASQITQGIQDLMVKSGPLGAVAEIAGALVHKAQDAWDDEEKAVVSWWSGSATAKVVAGIGSAVQAGEKQLAGFPQNVFDAVAASIAPAIPPITLPPIPDLASPLDSLLGAVGAGAKEPLIGHWKAITVGTAANALVPGAAAIAKETAKAIDAVGNATKATGDALTAAMTKVTTDLAATKVDTRAKTDDLGDIVGRHLDELAKVSVSALVIPPAKGGIHQLGWALSQGLNEGAANAPLISDDEACFAIFICGGAPDITHMTKTIRQVGQVFGIPLLANWGTI